MSLAYGLWALSRNSEQSLFEIFDRVVERTLRVSDLGMDFVCVLNWIIRIDIAGGYGDSEETMNK